MIRLLAAASVASIVLAAPPAAQPKRVKPKTGTLAVKTLPGGWLAQLAGPDQHVDVDVPGYAGASGRVLVLSQATSDDYAQLLAADVTLIDAAGKVLKKEGLAANRPYDGDLSPDGTFAAVLAHPFVTGGEQAFVFGMDDKGAKWRKPADPESVLVAGNGWVALTRPPIPAAAAHGDEEHGDVAQRPFPVTFFKRDGTPLKAPQPIAGAFAKSDAGAVSVAEKKLTIYDGKLAKKAQADVPFAIGFPSVAANGSLIAVADFGAESADGMSKVALFDGAAKPLGSFALKAIVGVRAEVSPDGTAVLAAPAMLKTGPVAASAGKDELALRLFDRTGKEKWKYAPSRRSPDEAFVTLSVSKGGTRAAAGIATGDEEQPSKALVFDDKGAVIYEAEGEFQALWLDPTGEWLYTVEPGAVSRLKLSALRAGKAFPEESDEEDGPDVEHEIEEEDRREYPDGKDETFPDEAPSPAATPKRR